MNIVFLGCTKFSEDILVNLLENGINVSRIFSIPEEFRISYSQKKVKNYNFSDLSKLANELNIPFYFVDSKPGEKLTDYKQVIQECKPDIILVMGWYFMVPKSIREIAKYGAWGIHASLLPKYAGGAPLVWAMINGEKKTGVTLFKLTDGIDDGDIIDQKEFVIKDTDTIVDVYSKATDFSANMLVNSIKNVDLIQFKQQNKKSIEVYPQRKPEDGEINLNWGIDRIFNFIRAQVAPYPGAFIKSSDGKKLIIEKIRIESE